MMIPQTLLDVQNYLREANLPSVTGGVDGRLDSAEMETRVVQAIQNANRWKAYSPTVDKTNSRD